MYRLQLEYILHPTPEANRWFQYGTFVSAHLVSFPFQRRSISRKKRTQCRSITNTYWPFFFLLLLLRLLSGPRVQSTTVHSIPPRLLYNMHVSVGTDSSPSHSSLDLSLVHPGRIKIETIRVFMHSSVYVLCKVTFQNQEIGIRNESHHVNRLERQTNSTQITLLLDSQSAHS